MQIVGNSFFLRNLRNLPFFTLDLGLSKRVPNSTTHEMRKLDDFIIRYRNLYNNDLMKFGKIGEQITFYEDLRIKQEDIKIFHGDDIYELVFDKDRISDFGDYIIETIRAITEPEEKEKDDAINQDKIKEYASNDEVWVSNDDKNGQKSYTINQNLSREEYRKAIYDKFMKKA